MKRIYLSALGLALTVILGLPQVTNAAYNTTAQSAQVAGPTTALFTISYAFGMANQAVYMPIMTTRGLVAETDKTNSFRVGYQIERKDGTVVTTGTANALVLSSMPISGTMYRIPAGQSTQLTLVALVTLPANTPFSDYRLHVTKLPFIFSDANNPNDLEGLNKYELSQYVTPAVPLGTVRTTMTAPAAASATKPTAAAATPTPAPSSAATNPNFHW
jgi:hypothetical protein